MNIVTFLNIKSKYKSNAIFSFELCRTIFIFVFLISSKIQIFATEYPPIIKYLPEVYIAGNQNWKITQDSKNFMYFANNDGLLEFNGSEWTLYPCSNETIIRSVKVVGNKIFTGCYMDFGYWQRQSNGMLKYYSLAEKLKDKILENENFWDILYYDNWVLFQSLDRIYLYNMNSKEFKIIHPPNGVWKMYLINNNLYYQSLHSGLFVIKNGKSILVSENKILKENIICNIYQKTDQLYIQTENAGLYIFDNYQIKKYGGINEKYFNNSQIIRNLILSDGSIVLGTISNGVYIMNSDFGFKYHLSKNIGLSNNTVLSLFEDKSKNLWIGTDNGINCVNLNSEFKTYVDRSGILGTIYASKLSEGTLYLGTNQGLFSKKYDSDDDFKFIEGTKGQVWSLFEYDGTIFCGHTKGTFIVNGNTATNIYSGSGTWKFNKIDFNKDILVQGNFNGLSILKRISGKWVFSHKIQGFNISTRYFEMDDDNLIYVYHEYKGIYRIKPDIELKNAENIFIYKNPEKSKNAGFGKYFGKIIYASENGFYILNNKDKEFDKDSVLNKGFEKDNYISGKLILDSNDRMWYFTKEGISYFYNNNLDLKIKKNDILINPSLIRSVSGYENIELLHDNKYLIGYSEGYSVFNFSKLSNYPLKININKFSAYQIDQIHQICDMASEIVLSSNSNNIEISYSIASYDKFLNFEFQYLLEGSMSKWSNWSSDYKAIFKNLPSGKYNFRVRGKRINDNLVDEVKIPFIIKKPFYLTFFAFFVYILFGLLVVYFVNNYYVKQKNKLIAEHNLKLEIQKLENEQKLIKIQNIELSHDVDEKDKELAYSNLDLLRKNELLKLIKDDIKKSKSENPNLRKFISLLSDLNENIVGKDSWSVFKQSFDRIDRDFLKRLFENHNSLTASDLKLCAYLRLNLSSKEIAPLLNISERSVEIKRYRLRKKLNLKHDESLTNYILNF
jgi:AraC family transcriptional regulator, chitin signaling transcriptional activator